MPDDKGRQEVEDTEVIEIQDDDTGEKRIGVPRKDPVSPKGCSLAKDRNDRNALILRLTADMFRQHSDLYLKQAAILERIATDPSNPASWKIDAENNAHVTPEAIQDQLAQENAVTLAIKSYESMLHVQKRADYMERLMIRNNVSTVTVLKKGREISPESDSDSKTDPFYWFMERYREEVKRDLGEAGNSSRDVRASLTRLWNTFDPAQRQPFIEKAQEVASRLKEAPEKSTPARKRKRK